MAVEIKPEIISEIAQFLDAGMLCFYRKTTGQLIDYPDGLDDLMDDDYTEMWADIVNKVQDNLDDYISFEPMNSTEAFKIMEDFTESIGDSATRIRFLGAISRKKPFRQFGDLLLNYPELRTQWFAYKNEKYIDFVKEQIESE